MKQSPRSAPRSRGYTMIEVMMALAVLTVGSVGVIAMQKVAVVGNATAKSIATATALADRWAERLRVDAMVWNNSSPSDIAESRWLKKVSTPGVWTLPDDVAGKASPLADPLGADIILAGDTSAVAYCTHISYRQITPKMVSAVIRVTWRRDSSASDCSAPEMFVENTDAGRYGAVYMTTGLMVQEQVQ